MPINQVSRESRSGIYFVTPTIQRWYYVFDRHDRWQILADSLMFLQSNRALKLHGFVFMLNHVHLILQAPDVSACLRDFKRHTSKQIRKSIEKNEPQVLDLFIDSDGDFRLWKTDNQPRLIENERFYIQKLNYIHNNPVAKGYVERPEYWKWSSANPACKVQCNADL